MIYEIDSDAHQHESDDPANEPPLQLEQHEEFQVLRHGRLNQMTKVPQREAEADEQSRDESGANCDEAFLYVAAIAVPLPRS